MSAELIASSREVAVSIGVAEVSVNSAEGETSVPGMVVAVGCISLILVEGMPVPISEASIDEVNRLGRSIVEVAPAKFVILLGNSSERLEIIASVVVGDRAISLEIALLRVVASACVLTTPVDSIERL